MTSSQPLSIVVRIPDVSLSHSDLNASLGLLVDRYEASGDSAYGQIDIAESEDQWAAALHCIRSIGATLARLVSEGSIGASSLDIAMDLPHSSLSKSLTIPADLISAAGQAGMDVQLSVYATK